MRHGVNTAAQLPNYFRRKVGSVEDQASLLPGGVDRSNAEPDIACLLQNPEQTTALEFPVPHSAKGETQVYPASGVLLWPERWFSAPLQYHFPAGKTGDPGHSFPFLLKFTDCASGFITHPPTILT